jgi:hypothetical protein
MDIPKKESQFAAYKESVEGVIKYQDHVGIF